MTLWLELMPHGIGLLLLFGLSAFFSGSETALFSLNRAQVKRMSGGTIFERAAAELLRQPQRLLSTVLVGNMLVNVMIASVMASLSRRFFAGGGVGMAIAITTFLLLVFGEVTPKTIAIHHPRAFALSVALPLRLFSRLIMPARVVLRWITNAFLILLGQRHVPGWGMLMQEELAAMLAAGEATGATDRRERELVENILDLGMIEAHDIMVPRTEVHGVSDDLTLEQAFAEACRWRHSRLPVYGEDLDDIWGILAVVDLPRWRDSEHMSKPLHALRGADNGTPLPGPIYPVHVVPETARVEQLLASMRERRMQLVVIVDEYGGTAGILTLDDILEEVVGQLSPTDPNEAQDIVFDNGTPLVDGRLHIRDLNRELAADLPEADSDTIGGLVMERLGRLPRAGDGVRWGDWHLEVVKMAGRRVGIVRMTRQRAADEEVSA